MISDHRCPLASGLFSQATTLSVARSPFLDKDCVPRLALPTFSVEPFMPGLPYKDCVLRSPRPSRSTKSAGARNSICGSECLLKLELPSRTRTNFMGRSCFLRLECHLRLECQLRLESHLRLECRHRLECQLKSALPSQGPGDVFCGPGSRFRLYLWIECGFGPDLLYTVGLPDYQTLQ